MLLSNKAQSLAFINGKYTPDVEKAVHTFVGQSDKSANLTKEEKQKIAEICGQTMQLLGYQLPD